MEQPPEAAVLGFQCSDFLTTKFTPRQARGGRKTRNRLGLFAKSPGSPSDFAKLAKCKNPLIYSVLWHFAKSPSLFRGVGGLRHSSGQEGPPRK